MTSYMGVEIIAVTAGEAEHPEVTIPHAMRNIVWRLILFYVLAIAIMVTMVPWNQTGNSSTLSGSPFVAAFSAAHVPFAAAIMNFVVLTAALSSVNTNLYLSTRMLFSLGREGLAPGWMGMVSSNGVPHRALIASTGRNCRRHTSGGLRPKECVSRLVRHCGGWNAFRVAHHSQYSSTISQGHSPRATVELTHALSGSSVFHPGRNIVARCDRCNDLLC